MSMGKYISWKEFNEHANVIKQKIVSKIAKEEGVGTGQITVDFKIRQKDKIVDTYGKDIRAIILSDE